jgi:hypothetical protein
MCPGLVAAELLHRGSRRRRRRLCRLRSHAPVIRPTGEVIPHGRVLWGDFHRAGRGKRRAVALAEPPPPTWFRGRKLGCAVVQHRAPNSFFHFLALVVVGGCLGSCPVACLGMDTALPPPIPCFCETSLLSGPGKRGPAIGFNSNKEKGGQVRDRSAFELGCRFDRDSSLFPICLGCIR